MTTNGNAAPAREDRVRTARRIGMSVILVVIVWTIVAVTVGVVRGLYGGDGAPAVTAEP